MSRPAFDELKGGGPLCFRAPDTPVQPCRKQLVYELKQLFCHPCAFSQGRMTWREIFAVSSVRCIPAGVLLVIRWLFAITQVTIVTYSLVIGWRKIYFFTKWTNILVAAYYVGLSLCSTAAFLLKSAPVNPRIPAESMHLKDTSEEKSLPVLLRLVESASSVAIGSSLVICVVYWLAISPTAEEVDNWVSYYDHMCFIPVFAMAVLSRIPYRLNHMWLSVIFASCYCSLCCIVAFVPLTTWKGKVGYVYNVMNYQTKPLQAWLISGLFTVFLPPISYMLFWFLFRVNNPES